MRGTKRFLHSLHPLSSVEVCIPHKAFPLLNPPHPHLLLTQVQKVLVLFYKAVVENGCIMVMTT